jgi:flagellar biosynthesis protein FlhG
MMEALPAVVPATAARPRRQVWSVGGGKGGIGKSLLTAALGYQLARMGRRVVLVDADLGGANLHTCLGLPGPSLTLGDFIFRRAERIEDVLVETGVPGLRLISGASDFLAAANIKYAQKVRVLNRLRALDVDIILMDLGAGTSFNIIDFFLISDVGILTVVPEPTSVENGYRFIKSALYRRLRGAVPSAAVRAIVDSALDHKNPLGIRTPLDLLAAVEREDASAVAALKRELATFNPRFVMNQVRDLSDSAIGHQLVTACARHLGVRATYAGYIPYDDTVWRCVRQRRLFLAASPDCPAAQKVRDLTRGLMQGESLSLSW